MAQGHWACEFIEGKNAKFYLYMDVGMAEVEATMFLHGRGVIAYIKIWHKLIEHVNL